MHHDLGWYISVAWDLTGVSIAMALIFTLLVPG